MEKSLVAFDLLNKGMGAGQSKYGWMPLPLDQSGSTLESAIAFRIIRQAPEKKYGKEEAKSRIAVVSSRGENRLNKLAQAKGYLTIYNDSGLSGRYQLMTVAGLLPICIAGYDINGKHSLRK